MYKKEQNFNNRVDSFENNINKYIECDLYNPNLPTSKEVTEIINYLKEDIDEYKELMGDDKIDEYYHYAVNKTDRLEQTISVMKYYEKYIKDDDYVIVQRRLDYSE